MIMQIQQVIKKMKSLYGKIGTSSSIRWDGERFLLRDNSGREYFGISDISEIGAIKCSKITYDELFLKLSLDDGRVLFVGELCDGFNLFEEILMDRLIDFKVDWKFFSEKLSDNAQLAVWRRAVGWDEAKRNPNPRQ